MATRSSGKPAKPAAKKATAVRKARAGKPPATPARKPATKSGKKSAKPAAKPKASARRGGISGRVELGTADILGARYRVFAKPPRRIQRGLHFDRRDKADINVRVGDSIEWLAPRAKAFRIQFTGQPPDLNHPDRRSFPSRLASGKQRVEVAVSGHPPGTQLDYDIFQPPDAAKPLDPSLIIYPNAELYLMLA